MQKTSLLSRGDKIRKQLMGYVEKNIFCTELRAQEMLLKIELAKKLCALVYSKYDYADMAILRKYDVGWAIQTLRILFKDLPDGEQAFSTRISLKEVPEIELPWWPNNSYYELIGDLSCPIIADAYALVSLEIEIKEKENKLHAAYRKLIYSHNTAESLAQVWPEVFEVLGHKTEAPLALSEAEALIKANLCERGKLDC